MNFKRLFGKSKTVCLKDIKGNILFRHKCKDNSVKKTLEAARNMELRHLFIEGEDLSGIDMTGMYIISSVFILCSFNDAKIDCATLWNNVFIRTDFNGATFQNTNLSHSVFKNCHLVNCDFTGALVPDMSVLGATVYSPTFKDINNLDTTYFSDGVYSPAMSENQYYPLACPSDGSFIGWKQIVTDEVRGALVKLEIPEDARRASAMSPTRKCRCDKAKVLDIIDLDTGEHLPSVFNRSISMNNLEYVVGEMVYPDSFDADRWNECSHGIHFFINRQDAINYWR